MLVLAGGNAVLGTVSTVGRLGIGGYSLLTLGGGRTNFSKTPVLAAFDANSAAASGGSVSVGAINASRVDANVGTDLTTATVTAGNVRASAGGTATINGQWTIGQTARVRSNDIVIASGGISAGQSVTLQSTNAGGSFIGDGLTPTGYALSNGEFATLSAPVILVGHSLGGLVSYGAAPLLAGAIGGIASIGSPSHFTRGSLSLQAIALCFEGLRRAGVPHLGMPVPV